MIHVMMCRDWTGLRMKGKSIFATAFLFVAACTVNPATGQQQFTALMSPAQEIQTGDQEHEKIIAGFGMLEPGDPVQAYVERVGARVAANAERQDVPYKFFVLDTPMVNAFALPGGYVYVTRGLLAQANSEAELAAVLAHETGHIAARHAAERYSQGVLGALGVSVVAAATDNTDAATLAAFGNDLYIGSYSRGQELEADGLGVRYLSRAGYDAGAMARFLVNLGAYTDFEAVLRGSEPSESAFNYFSTHPRTEERVNQASIAAGAGLPQAETGRNAYLEAIDGLAYGDSERQGFVRGESFYHPGLNFTFTAPKGSRIRNEPSQVVVKTPGDAIAIFDAVEGSNAAGASGYLTQDWMAGQVLEGVSEIDINGMPAATASLPGQLRGRSVKIRLVAVVRDPQTMYRFQIAIPEDAPPALVEDLKRMTYSLRPLDAMERQTIGPSHISIIKAEPADTVASLSGVMSFEDRSEERFRVLNGMNAGDEAEAGRYYKVVSSAPR